MKTPAVRDVLLVAGGVVLGLVLYAKTPILNFLAGPLGLSSSTTPAAS